MERATGKVLIVDSDVEVDRSVYAVLEPEYACTLATTGTESLELAQRSKPGIVLLDVATLGSELEETVAQLRSVSRLQLPQIILMTKPTPEVERGMAAEIGADDCVTKPINSADLKSRLAVHLRLADAVRRTQSLESQLDAQHTTIQELTSAQMQEVIEMQDLAVFTLADVAESRDLDTGQHLIRMREYTHLLGERLRADSPYADQIDDRFLDDLYRSSPLHDIGKVGISDAILLKPDGLTPDEYAAMQRHTLIGAHILDRAVTHSGSGGFLAMAAIIARFHHERWDGKGYPAGLVEAEIPLPARIVSVADVYDALTSKRPYKRALPAEEAKAMVEAGSGSHFDPVIVEAFRQSFAGFQAAQAANLDTPATTMGAISFLEYDFEADLSGDTQVPC